MTRNIPDNILASDIFFRLLREQVKDKERIKSIYLQLETICPESIEILIGITRRELLTAVRVEEFNTHNLKERN